MANNFWFKFNFKDWANDVKPLSLMARGMLLELIIYMRQSPTPGIMPNDIRLIIRITGCLTEEATECLSEFKKFGILDFEQNDDLSESIVSRKIIKEFERSRINAENGEKGGNPKLKTKIRLTDLVKQNDNQTSNSIFNSNSISNLSKKDRVEKFEIFWGKYGKKSDRKKCEDKWMKLSDQEVSLALEKVDAYVASTPDVQYRKNPLTWINGKCWNDEILLLTQIKNSSQSGFAGVEKIDSPNVKEAVTSYGWKPPYSFRLDFEPKQNESEQSYRNRVKIWAQNQ